MSSQNTTYDPNIRPYQFLDVVRGLAIIWICWYHIDQLMSPVRSNIAKLGYSGVSVFIILSGFGLTFSMLKNDILSSSYNNKLLTNWKNFPWKKFFLKRFFRIYPLYILAHIIFLILGFIMGKYEDMPLNIGLLLSITGLRVFFKDYFWYGPDAFWYVGLIIQLYILFPFLFFLIKRIGNVHFLILSVVFCSISRIVTISLPEHYTLMLGLSPNRLAEFSLGMAIAYSTLMNKNMQLNSLKNKYIYSVIFSGTLIIIFLNFQTNLLLREIFIDPIIGVVALYILTLISLLIMKIKIVSIYFVFMGNISYSFYLLHSPPIRPAFAAFTKLSIDNYYLITFLYITIITIVSFGTTWLESRLLNMLYFKNKN
ncbi:acyltransferase [Dolichospermum sp. ST_sed9]|nr:acyltransferase [Dolichospermum sp. ST_sed9]